MCLDEFNEMCKNHDYWYSMVDNYREWKVSFNTERTLLTEASKCEKRMALYRAWEAHRLSGHVKPNLEDYR